VDLAALAISTLERLLIRKRPAPASPRAPGEVVLRRRALARSRTERRLQKMVELRMLRFVNPASAHVSSAAAPQERSSRQLFSPALPSSFLANLIDPKSNLRLPHMYCRGKAVDGK